MNNNIYLMVNGTKIELPIETIEKIKSAQNITKSVLIDKFYSLAIRKYSAFEKRWIDIVHKSGDIHGDGGYFMMIKYPNCNSSWSYAIFDACKEFCGPDNANQKYYPTHYSNQHPDYLYIKLTDFKE